jgi:hypothetical protein
MSPFLTPTNELALLLSRIYSCLTTLLSQTSRQVQCLFSLCLHSRVVLGSGRHKLGALFSLFFAASFKAEITKLYAVFLLDKAALLRDKIDRTRRDLQ